MLRVDLNFDKKDLIEKAFLKVSSLQYVQFLTSFTELFYIVHVKC